MNFIAALNSLNQPWVAILVIILGMTFDIVCKRFGVSADAATGVIGAGVGLLTGQAIQRATNVNSPSDPAIPSSSSIHTVSGPSPSTPASVAVSTPKEQP